jgi:hypothetical protein
MSHDPTEGIRRHLVSESQQQTAAVMEAVDNDKDSFRAALELQHGKVWTTAEAQEEFQFLGFAAPFAVVARRSGGQKGSLCFTGSPRFYYGFDADK